MTKSKNSKRALLASLLSMFVCIAMLIGSTFAWFTDTAATSVNSIKSGTLTFDLVNEGGESIEGKTLYFKNADGETDILWEPGATYNVDGFKIKNTGSLALKYSVIIDGIDGDDELLEAIDFTVKEGSDAARPLENWECELLEPESESKLITITGHMKESAGNEYQNKTLDGIKITVNATQTPYEKDSIDNQYDKNANAAAVFGTEIKNELKDPDVAEVVAGEDIDLGDTDFTNGSHGGSNLVMPNGKVLDLNGNSVIMPAHMLNSAGSGVKFENGTTATVKNGTVTQETDNTMVDVEYGATATFEEVHFIGCGDDAIRMRASGEGNKATLIFKNCTFDNAGVEINGMNGASQVDVQFIGCTFKGSYKLYAEDDTEHDNPLTDLYGNVHYMTTFIDLDDSAITGDVLVKDCTFDYDASEITGYGSGYGIDARTFNNCEGTLNITLDNVTMNSTGTKFKAIDSSSDDDIITKTGCNF